VIGVLDAAQASGLPRPGDFWFGLYRYPQYLIEASGRVMSLVRRPRILKPIKCGEYVGFDLVSREGKSERVYLHRLIAQVGYGPCPSGMEACHGDGDRTNNDLSNLRWDTHFANEQDKRAHGGTPAGERNGMARLTRARVEEMRRVRTETGAPYHRIADQFGVSTMTAFRAVTGQSWRVS
jgi:hypothetical protein